VSVVTTATPERVWQVYRALAWQEWDHDIDSMRELAPGTGLVEGAKVEITMKKDGKVHEAKISKALENRSFTYTAPLPGATMTAIHTLEPVSSMLLCLADGSFERVCCYFLLLESIPSDPGTCSLLCAPMVLPSCPQLVVTPTFSQVGCRRQRDDDYTLV
jgi:hypothetical protein